MTHDVCVRVCKGAVDSVLVTFCPIMIATAGVNSSSKLTQGLSRRYVYAWQFAEDWAKTPDMVED